jgi:hypothetical protein
MNVVDSNQTEELRRLKADDVSVVEFDNYDQYRSFTVQLCHYNAGRGLEKGVFIHASSKKCELQYCLVAVSVKEHKRELSNSKFKNKWKAKIPQEWKRA